MRKARSHFFYLARCADGSLYAGTCVDAGEREHTHNEGKGAKYTRSRRPVRFVHVEELADLAAARRREAEVKRWQKTQKEALVKGRNPGDLLPPRQDPGMLGP